MRTNLRTNCVLAGVLLLLLPGFVAADPAAAATTRDGAPVAGASKDEPRLQLSVPLFSQLFSDAPVAQVGNDTITVRDLGESLAMTHSGHSGAAKKQEFAPLLGRLIDARLIVLEARDMELDELPEVKNAYRSWRTNTLREELKTRAAIKVTPDEEAVQSVYRQMVQEWKVRSVAFETEEDAVAFAASAKDPAAFTSGASSAIAAGKARGKDESEYVGRAKGLPQVLAELEKMKVGDVSRPVKIGARYAVVLVEDTRFPEVPEARAEAEKVVANPLMREALRDYYKALTKKHATVDRKLLAAIDYRPSRLAALEKDKRPLARIRGEAPVTVADLHAELRNQFFHGLDRAAKENKINPKKQEFFDAVLFRRLLDKEAKEQRLAEEPSFRRQAADLERSLLFAAFVERVIVPEVKVDEDSVRAYYDAHQDEFKLPDFFKLETIGFAKAREAQAACEKLKAGTDVKWLKANADGQLAPKDRSLQVDGTTVTASSMPEGLASVLSGAGARDCRIWARSDDENYAVFVVEKIASTVQPFDEARESIEKKVFTEKLARSVDDWAKRLRKAHDVNVFITGMGG
jgi:parvulin-like peptidyl-prolyl isomerase